MEGKKKRIREKRKRKREQTNIDKKKRILKFEEERNGMRKR